jgi:hypothetical protein
MMNPITSSSVTASEPAQARTSPSTAAPQPANPAQDSLHLSPQALSALSALSSGDVDHDGDSH